MSRDYRSKSDKQVKAISALLVGDLSFQNETVRRYRGGGSEVMESGDDRNAIEILECSAM